MVVVGLRLLVLVLLGEKEAAMGKRAAAEG
jgi:hypothetical protein